MKKENMLSRQNHSTQKVSNFGLMAWWKFDDLFFHCAFFCAKLEGMGEEHKSNPYYVNNR